MLIDMSPEEVFWGSCLPPDEDVSVRFDRLEGSGGGCQLFAIALGGRPPFRD